MKARFSKAVWTAGISILAVSRVTIAQPGALAPSPMPAPDSMVLQLKSPLKRQQLIRLRHISPSLMAYWLDPVNHAAPPGNVAPVSPKAKFSLPAGIERIISIDSQKALLVFGSDWGVQELRERVAFVDRPQTQVRFDTHFVTLKNTDLNPFLAGLVKKSNGKTVVLAVPPAGEALFLSQLFPPSLNRPTISKLKTVFNDRNRWHSGFKYRIYLKIWPRNLGSVAAIRARFPFGHADLEQ